MNYEILGPLRVTHGDEEVDLGSRKQRTLLALLIVNANRVVTTERIIDELWPGDPEGHENALWVYISRLRSVLEPDRSGRSDHRVLQTRDHCYSLTISVDAIDANRYERLVSDANQVGADDPAAASKLLREAEQLWRGRALEGIDADFVLGEATRLDEMRLSALEQRFDLDLRVGSATNLAAEIETTLLANPYRERMVGQLMLALYRGGRQADALRTFERFRRTIGEDLGIDPSPELVRLEEQILLHDSRLQPRRSAARPSAPAATAVDVENPFKGLRAFSEDDSEDFFGRDRLVADVIRRVEEGHTLLSLVGPSGSGKSSALRAGVIPSLRKGSAGGSDRWLIAQMVPGARPFAELEAALLRSTLDAPHSVMDQLRGEDGLLGAVLRLLPTEDSRLVLVVDQFEELFTLVEDDESRASFLDCLLPALEDPRGRVIVLLTLRADFYGRAISYAEIGRRMGDGVINVVPLTPDELEAAAVQPMMRVGCHFEPALLVSLLGDVAGQPGALPVFQYTLTELYERRVGDMLTTAAYQQMGGVRGALAQRAEDLFDSLDEAEQPVAREMFLRMVTIGDGDSWGRRRVTAAEVLGLDVDVVSLQTVIHRFGDHRLLSFDRDPVSGSPTLEVAHEALLTEWPRLRDWIAEAEIDVQHRTSVGAAAVEWSAAGRNPDYLFTGTRLKEHEEWQASSALTLTGLEKAFLDEAIEKRERDLRADADRIAREQALDRRARIRTWGLAAGLVLVAGVAAWLVIIAGGDGEKARIARFRPLIAENSVIRQQLENGWSQAESEFTDLSFDPVLEAISDPAAQLLDLVETEPDLVIFDGLTGEVDMGPGSYIERIAADHPDQLFAIPAELFWTYDNIISFDFATNEGSFLAGVAAATASESGVVGFIGGLPFLIDPFRAGFEAGARFARPDVQVLNSYLVGSGFDVFVVGSDAQAVTNDLMDRGADVIYHAIGQSGSVIRRAVGERGRVWFIGVDVDESLIAPPEEQPFILTSMLKRHDLAIVELARRLDAGELDAGELEAGVIRGDVSNGVIGLVTPGNMSAEVSAAVESARQALNDGGISVPRLPDRPPIVTVGTDYSVRLDLAGTDCELEPFEPEAGDVVRFELANRTSGQVGVSLWNVKEGIPPDEITLEGLGSGEQAAFGTDPETATFLPAGATGALTVSLDDPGDWVLECFGEPDSVGSHFESVTVVEPVATSSGEVHIGGSDTSPTCDADLGGVATGDAVEFTLTSDLTQPVAVEFYEVADGTSLGPGWIHGSGARSIRNLMAVTGAEPARGVVRFDRPGSYAVECFFLNDTFDHIGGTVFEPA